MTERLTPAQKRALTQLHNRGGRASLGRYGSAEVDGKPLAPAPQTWLRLMLSGHIERDLSFGGFKLSELGRLSL